LCRVCGPAKKKRKEGCIMRKISLILVVLLMAAPAWSAVTITCSNVGYEVTVSYNFTGEPNSVRAFALDITIDTGTITDVNDDVNPDYTIYPGSIVIAGGVVTDDGNAVADPCDYPSDTQSGVGSSGITVEMGALYSPPIDPCGPPPTGDLLKFTVSGDCNVTITENEARGGVVLTDPTKDPTSFTAPGTGAPEFGVVGACFPSSYTTYNDWVALGSPDCWCSAYQCDGDADGTTYGPKKYRVFGPDLTILIDNWKKVITDPSLDPCADFDHKPYGPKKYRVFGPDLTILIASWKSTDAGLPGDCPRPE